MDAEIVQAKFVSNEPMYLLVPLIWMSLMVIGRWLFAAGTDGTSIRENYRRSGRFTVVSIVIAATVFLAIEQQSAGVLWLLVVLVPAAFLMAPMVLDEGRLCPQCGNLIRRQSGVPQACQGCSTLLGGHPDLPNEL